MATTFAGRRASSTWAIVLCFFALYAAILVTADDDPTCTAKQGCDIGCCGPLNSTGIGICGTGPNFCGDDCTSQCDYKAECDPGWGLQYSNASTCPLDVCCSAYGFCGTTSDFCGSETVTSPSCDVSAGSSNARTVGYYEGWNWQRDCGNMAPEDIPLGYYTHINFAFSLIDPDTYRLAPMDDTTGTLYTRVSAIKDRSPGLEVWVAIGGWAFNDPGSTRTTFSDLAGSQSAQDEFLESLVSFLTNNGFDGVDLDWEYPDAEDRGGVEADYDNYVSFLKNIRTRLDETGVSYGLSITLPASYWYLKGFNIVDLEPYCDWFNIMTYDIHGVWDSNVTSIGSYAYAHTNLTEINLALELLWRNNINPERVNLGLGFYGRIFSMTGFTMESSDCLAAGCPFKDGTGAAPGECTGTAGVLSSSEINKIINSTSDVTVTLDEEAAVMIATWDGDQWVSYDNVETLATKVNYANSRCLGGTMIWAVDLDDGTLIGSLGESLGRPKMPTIPELPITPFCFGGSDCLVCNLTAAELGLE
ncbi:putative chitinase [Seiridium unicorne]|uniref:chitinase n=1 Tax=Seiridium unicorne TaxID=138068 RepID=A0ABR2UIS7_9PEZI